MDLNEFAKRAHDNAVKKGFWDKEIGNGHYLMLIITEISEAVEADRKGKYANLCDVKDGTSFDPRTFNKGNRCFVETFEKYIKDTVEDELADVAIRLADLAGALEIEFEEEDYKEDLLGFMSTFTENAFELVKVLTDDIWKVEGRIKVAFNFLFSWTKSLNINLWYHIEKKMEYNELRGKMHGKKY